MNQSLVFAGTDMKKKLIDALNLLRDYPVSAI